MIERTTCQLVFKLSRADVLPGLQHVIVFQALQFPEIFHRLFDAAPRCLIDQIIDPFFVQVSVADHPVKPYSNRYTDDKGNELGCPPGGVRLPDDIKMPVGSYAEVNDRF